MEKEVMEANIKAASKEIIRVCHNNMIKNGWLLVDGDDRTSMYQNKNNDVNWESTINQLLVQGQLMFIRLTDDVNIHGLYELVIVWNTPETQLWDEKVTHKQIGALVKQSGVEVLKEWESPS